MKKLNVIVLMSTYNGRRYIKEQIDSIFGQQGINDLFNLKLLIRDDGSSDGTVDIINTYSSNVELISDGLNLGPKRSFFELIRQADDNDIFFFSDQDDIWPEDKVLIFLKEFQKRKLDLVPLGVYSDIWISDEFGKSTGKSMAGTYKWEPSAVMTSLIWDYRITGAAFAVNQRAINYLKTVDDKTVKSINMHDSFMGLMIGALGEIIQINTPLLFYRQHGHNVIGASNSKASLMWRIKQLFSTGQSFLLDSQLAVESILNNPGTDMYEYISQVRDMLNERSLFKRLKYFSRFVADIRITKYKVAVLFAVLLIDKKIVHVREEEI
ncbi:glycosyltransferase family 2 protein [Leuconostoc falkenbergense]|uniref:glycosyltransferase family 2 protein n=1 Tax=Leuconostoc falkenbergense TaxID=2766470 RepID=UPI0028ADD1FF|nr:glycosyltransferase family 2 protein [Leuconostoc falkenbergense]